MSGSPDAAILANAVLAGSDAKSCIPVFAAEINKSDGRCSDTSITTWPRLWRVVMAALERRSIGG